MNNKCKYIPTAKIKKYFNYEISFKTFRVEGLIAYTVKGT